MDSHADTIVIRFNFDEEREGRRALPAFEDGPRKLGP